MATAKTGNPVGRPSKYTPELAEHICDLIASGELLKCIYAVPGMPSENTVERWKARYPDFGGAYARARKQSAAAAEQRVAELVVMVVSGEIESKAASVAIAANQWLAKVRDRATYGDKQAFEASEDNAGLSLDELKAKGRAVAIRLLAAMGGDGTIGRLTRTGSRASCGDSADTQHLDE